VFGRSTNNADKYIKCNKLSDGNWQFIIDNLINWQYVYMSRPLAIKHFLYMFNFVLLGQLTFNYFKMHLLNNQLCLYLIICLCKQIYAICTPRTELVHRTCWQWSSFSIVRIQNKSLHREILLCNIFLVYRFSDCISSLSNFCMPRAGEGNLDSWSGNLWI
jgi:hypothetical protein